MPQLSSEEVRKFFENKKAAEIEFAAERKAIERLKRNLKAGKVNPPIPIWNDRKEDINLELQPHKLNDDIILDGYEILWVNFEELLDKLIQGNPKEFRKKKLFNRYFSASRMYRVWDNWVNGVKLIPPSIVSVNGKLFPADGKHRLNVAYYLGVREIPVFVGSRDVEVFCSIVNVIPHPTCN